MKTLTYRPDIDGLRTLAVVPVILFHAGASWLPGGFIGVDIFFVISGYLISSILLREIAAGNFSFLRFYERRLRRIIPALLVVLIVTVAVFQLIALPDQAKSTAESGIAGLLSISNVYFWRTSGYFAPAAEFMPLLHTWSLGVEEQFYLLFPVVLLVLARLRLPIGLVLMGITALGFALGYWLSVTRPSVAYYLLPARFWELGIGAVLAAGIVPAARSRALRELLPVAGLGLIGVSLVYIRSDMPFPGWVALIPCLGAALVIHGDGRSWVARKVLGASAMVFVGMLSYSLYLWHWPVLTALRLRSASLHLEPWVALAGIAATFLLAWMSWRLVERPFRNRDTLPGRRLLWQLGAGSAAFLALAGLAIGTGGFPARLGEQARSVLAASTDVDPLRRACNDIERHDQCRFGPAEGPASYAILGDSHAAALRPAIEHSGAMGETVGTLYWIGACPFLDGVERQNAPRPSSCASFRARIWDLLEADPGLQTVVLGGRWPYHLLGTTPESGGAYADFFVDDETVTPGPEENLRVFARALGRTLDRLAALGREVVIIGAVPEPGFDVPHTVALAWYNGIRVPAGIPRSEVARRAGFADEILARIAAGRPGVRVLSIWQDFCDAQSCRIDREGLPIYHDDSHLSHAGAVSVAAPAIAARARESR